MTVMRGRVEYPTNRTHQCYGCGKWTRALRRCGRCEAWSRFWAKVQERERGARLAT